MATIHIKYSQAVVDQEGGAAAGTAAGGSLGSLLDTVFTADYNVNKGHQYYSSWSWSGATLILSFPDGATKTYTGVVRADPTALQGTATATGYEFVKPGSVGMAENGLLNLDYQIVSSGTGYAMSLSESNAPSFTSAFGLTTLVPNTSTAYDPTLGNITLVIEGAMTSEASGKVSGTITKLTTVADKFILSNVIEGHFDVAGNSASAGQGLSATSVTGLLTSLKQDYADGSQVSMTGLSTTLGAAQALDARLLADGTRFSGNDTIDIDLPATLHSDFLMASGAGNDSISVKGGGGRLNVDAGSGNDKITIASGAHRIDGGAGTDTVLLAANRAAYTVTKSADGYTLTDGAGAASALIGVERIKFADATVAIDINGVGGEAYRIYQAAFDRVPDANGLGFWIKYMDAGMSVTAAATSFMDSAEFKTMYGSNPSHEAFVDRLYHNVLHRAGEASGVAFWLTALDNPEISYGAVLAAFSESAENQAALIGVIGNGFAYNPYPA